MLLILAISYLAVFRYSAVRGYQSAPQSLKGNLMGANLDQEAIRELSNKKQNLIMELNNYAENHKVASSATPSKLILTISCCQGAVHHIIVCHPK